MILPTIRMHKEKKFGEVFLGWFSQDHIELNVTWETKRMGKVVTKKENRGKRPLFIMRSEAEDLGWDIG